MEEPQYHVIIILVNKGW